VNVYCRPHHQSIGVVRLRGNPPRPSFEIRTPSWRDRFGTQIQATGRDNVFYNLRDTTRLQVPALGCPDCPKTRTVSVAALVDAFERGLPKIAL
jgi:hypothetical protein